MLIGGWFEALTSTLSAVVGVMCFAAGLQGYLLRDARAWERVALVAAALLLIKPGYASDGVGLALLAVVLVAQRATLRRSPA
jgi:TRAP-type uncharacterized transport system fused permease subunit